MAFCTKCGTNNPDGSKFCSSCGTVISANQELAQSTQSISKEYTPADQIDYVIYGDDMQMVEIELEAGAMNYMNANIKMVDLETQLEDYLSFNHLKEEQKMLKKKICTLALTLSLVVTAIPFAAAPAFGASGDTNSGLIAHWTFDGNVDDSKGMKNDTVTNITYKDGILGKAAVFDGSSSYIETVPNSSLAPGSKFTASFWTYNEDADYGNDTQTWLQLGKDAGWVGDYYYSSPYWLSRHSSSLIEVKLSNEYAESNSDYSTTGGTDFYEKSIDGRQWTLLTFTYDGSKVKIYKNSTLLQTKNYSDGITPKNIYGLTIGTNEGHDQYFCGMMDDLRIYSRPLAADDVAALYSAGLSASKEKLEPSNKVVASYKFEGNSKDGSTFGNDAKVVEGSGNISYVSGKKGKAISLEDGAYLSVDPSDSLNFKNKATITFWAKPNEQERMAIIARMNPSIGTNNENDFVYKVSTVGWSDTSLQMETEVTSYSEDDWAASFVQSIDYTREVASNTAWHHYGIVLSPSGSKIQGKIYFDGSLKATKVIDIKDIANGSGDLLIGFDGENTFDGYLDELQIYNYALSASDVKAQYTSSSVKDSISLSIANVKKLAAVKKGKNISIAAIRLKDGSTGDIDNIKSSLSSVKFKSSNKSVFTVTNSGKITGKKAGSAKLTITYSGMSKTYTVKVK